MYLDIKEVLESKGNIPSIVESPWFQDRVFSLAYDLTLDRSIDYSHSAIIFRRNKIISHGINKIRKTHPQGSGLWSSIHAEVDAILRADKNHFGRKTYILILRVSKMGKFRTSKPCKDCLSMVEDKSLIPIWTKTCEAIYEKGRIRRFIGRETNKLVLRVPTRRYAKYL